MGDSKSFDTVLRYHEETKHRPHRYARSSGFMDWENEPAPFRFYQGAERILLPLIEKDRNRSHAALYQANERNEPLSLTALAAFLELSLGLSAWKQYGASEWVLRMNPSSGNLHPTECYLILPPIGGHSASLAHYNPLLHCLEVRAELDELDSRNLEQIGGFGVILASIYWREAWKYGERAFRYCHLDVGHALGALAFANLSGWQLRLQVREADDLLDCLLGFDHFDLPVPENEHADCLCWVGGGETDGDRINSFLENLQPPVYLHPPNRLSRKHVDWSIIDEVARHSRSPGMLMKEQKAAATQWRSEVESNLTAEAIIRQRRSAQAFNPQTSRTDLQTLLQILARTLPTSAPPFDSLVMPPRVHLAVFIHRVDGLASGLYFLVRNADHFDELRADMDSSFEWTPVRLDLPFYLLANGDFRHTAAAIACQQDIAGDSAFSLAMLAKFEDPLREAPWLYPRLHWECGFIGQVLYLEAEAYGLRGTGIGCFLDDLMHDLLGLATNRWQDLYHFTVGKHLDDRRLQTKPPYYGLPQWREGEVI